jgi:hypothetical protein
MTENIEYVMPENAAQSEPVVTITTTNEPVEYEIVGAPVPTVSTAPQRLTIDDMQREAMKMSMLRRAVELEQRHQLRKRHKANAKTKNRAKAKMAKASRKRNR